MLLSQVEALAKKRERRRAVAAAEKQRQAKELSVHGDRANLLYRRSIDELRADLLEQPPKQSSAARPTSTDGSRILVRLALAPAPPAYAHSRRQPLRDSTVAELR